MITGRKIKPGEPGSKKYSAQYGDRLVCVRYRYDKKNNERITTVELIVDKGKIKTKSGIPHNKKVLIKINYDEYSLRREIKMFGGRWNGSKKLWEVDYKTADMLNITSRIEEVINK